jgi:uncharacterized protein
MCTIRCIVLTVVLTLLASCGSTPATRYYVLTSRATMSVKATMNTTLGVGPLTVSDYLKRPQIATTDGSNQLAMPEFDLWGEPLEKGITRILLENLATLTNNVHVESFPWRRDQQPDYAVRIHVIHLDRISTQRVRLKTRWTLIDYKDKKIIEQRVDDIQLPIPGAGFESLVSTYSDALFNLSQRIAQQVP